MLDKVILHFEHSGRASWRAGHTRTDRSSSRQLKPAIVSPARPHQPVRAASHWRELTSAFTGVSQVLLLLVLIQHIEVMVMAYNTWGSRLATVAALAVLSVGWANPAHAQFGKRLEDAAKRTAEDKAITKATDAEGKAIDSATAGGGKKGDSTAAAPAGQTSAAPAATARAPAAGAAGATAAATSPTDKKAWANYDFVPGQRT